MKASVCPQGGRHGGWPGVGVSVCHDWVSVSAVTGCLFCGVRGVGVGAWPVAGQVREAGHEQPHLPVRLLPGTTSCYGCPPSASSLPWAWPGRGANDLAGPSPHLDPLGLGRLTWGTGRAPSGVVLCQLPSLTPHQGAGGCGKGGGRGEIGPPLLSQTVDGEHGAEGAEGRGSFSVEGQEMISMQIRCKLPNEFAIRNRGCQARAASAGFMNGPAWGGVWGAARRPAPTFPCRCARDMPRRTLLPPGPAATWLAAKRVSCFGTGRGRLPARVPPAPPARDTPPGASRGVYPPASLSQVIPMVSRSKRQPWEGP